MLRIISKNVVFILIIALFISTLMACSPTQETPAPLKDDEAVVEAMVEEEMVLSMDELSQFDGKDGNKSYIAVDGIIYDVSDVPQWIGGMHRGFTAGMDVTDEVNKSPHGVSKLKGIKIVGKMK